MNATRNDNGRVLAHLEHWPSNPLFKGSYSCTCRGQFTSIAGNEGTRLDNLYFAGEHANSFYEWQGFMEGGRYPESRQQTKSSKASKWASSVE